MINRICFSTFLFVAVLSANSAQAEYVSERLFLGIYAQPDSTTSPVKMLPSGSEIEVLEEKGDFVRIKLADGSEGWARGEFITQQVPVSITVKQVTRQRDQLQAQLNAMGATEKTVKRLQKQLAQANLEIKALHKNVEGNQEAATERATQEQANQTVQLEELKQRLSVAEQAAVDLEEETKTLKAKLRSAGVSSEDTLAKIAWAMISMLLCLAIGAVLGAQWLGRRVRSRFNGRKVW